MPYRIGVDVGGTFTDLVVLDDESGDLQLVKVPSHPADQSLGMMNGLDGLGVDISAIDMIIHATTIATNAVLERAGARCGLITTKGFRDVIELRRRDRPDTYGLKGQFRPLVSRDMRMEVEERTDAKGNVVVQPTEGDIVTAAQHLLDRSVDVVIVSFLNSYANTANEQKAKRILESMWPNSYIVIGSEVLPEIREFERTSTAVINGYVQPLLDGYLRSLVGRLKDRDYTNEVLLVQGNGGLMSQATARRFPVNTILSGPAAGVIAAVHIGKSVGTANVITCDVGGTSVDIAVVEDGQSSTTRETSLEYGLPIRTSMLDVRSVGAGGGSIAWIDRTGFLQIGPLSAGAVPGPACYGQGGQDPTVTDANLVLGRIGISRPIGREDSWSFDKEHAERVIGEVIAGPLGLSVVDAAWAILQIANQRITSSIRLLTVERGYDPRDFALVVFGGAGPLHACSILNELQTAKAVIPVWPGVTSALGCIIADVRHDFTQMINKRLDDLTTSDIYDPLEQYAARGKRIIERAEILLEHVDVLHQADISYDGQIHEVLTPLPVERCSPDDVRRAFQESYRARYGHILEGRPIYIAALHTAVIGVRSPIDILGRRDIRASTLEDALSEHRLVYFQEGFEECPVYDRDRMPVNSSLTGPAIIEQADATTVIEPEIRVQIDERGNIILESAQ